jgi:hypothetical protein
MSLFSKYFNKTLHEDVGVTSAGAFGSGGETGGMFPGGMDSYAPGDARIPDILGSKKKKIKKKKRKSKKNKKKKRGVKKEFIKIQRRNLSRSL